MNSLEPITKSCPRRVIRSLDDLKKALDEGYYLYWIDTEGGMIDPSVQYLLQNDYIGKIGNSTSNPDRLNEMIEQSEKYGKLYDMFHTIPNTRIHV